MSDTHVNAYKMELAEAETAFTTAKSRVESLKRTIANMEPEQKESFGERMAKAKAAKAVEETAEVPETPVEVEEPTETAEVPVEEAKAE